MNTRIDALSLTRELISFNTINPPGLERACAEYLGQILEEAGFKISFHEFEVSRTSLVARLAGEETKPVIVFTGHMDTAPLGAASWSRDPFQGIIEEDKLYGRGTSDMKSGVAAMVVAALRMAQMSGGEAELTLIMTASEETGSQGAYHVAKFKDMVGEVGAIVVGEPTSNYPYVAHKGALWLEARTTGITAHGSMPEKGVNAIYKAADVVSKLRSYDFNAPPHPVLGGPTLNVGTISGGLNINSVPDRANIGIDMRSTPEKTNKEIFEQLESFLGEEVELKTVVDVGSVATDPEDEWVQQVFQIMEPLLKERPVPRGATYFTDASALTPAFGNPPTLLLGPGEPAMAHKTDEFCYIHRIEEATEAYFEIAKKWCNS